MRSKYAFRFFLATSSLAIFCGLIWQVLPTATAQKNIENTKAKSETVDSRIVPLNTDEILLNAVHINVKTDEAKAMRKTAGNFSGKRMHLVKFNGPIQPEWFDSLKADGLEIIDYIPAYSYLVYGTSDEISKMQNRSQTVGSPIEWDGEYLPEYRLHPNVYGVTEKGEVDKNRLIGTRYEVQLYKDKAVNNETLDTIRGLGTNNIISQYEFKHYVNIVADLGGGEGLNRIAGRSDVISIHPYIEPKKMDEAQNIIMTGQLTGNVPTTGVNYLTYLASKGFTQAQFDSSDFMVNVSDDGLDSGMTGTSFDPTSHFAFFRFGDPSLTTRLVYKSKQGTATDADTEGCAGHGTLNASIVGGYVPDGAPFNAFPHADAGGRRYGLGVAPFVKIGGSTIFTIAGTFTSPNIPNLESQSYNAGGRISTNSWGAATGGAYNANTQTYDGMVRDSQPTGSTFPVAGNQEMVILFSAGNSGSGANTTGAPGVGKNIISVGAAENVQPFGGADQCGIADTGADSANDIISFSSRGPADDGRIKPDIQAPGTHITGVNFQSTVPAPSPVSGNGSVATCFDASGVCAGTGTNNHFPAGQQFYTASSGTSHSCPATAGAAALIRQHFINQGLTPPSPAMTKAVLQNSARYMTGTGANDVLPSNNQGMGMVDLGRYFDQLTNSPQRFLRDQNAADLFTASGQQKTWAGNVADNTKPVRVTLAWTDPPGPTTGNAFINNLDLEVVVGGNTYLGNVFAAGGNSATGGAADPRNNNESVFVPAGVSGPMVVRVKATNIAGDGVPGNASALDQDFALIVSNINETPTAVPFSTGATITAESCGTGLVPDPGDLMTVSLPIQNGGTGPTTNLVATLQATGGVSSPTPASQNYGAIAPGDPAVTRNFQFTVSGTCGSTLTLTWNLTDGATNLGTVTKNVVIGTGGVTNVEFSNTASVTLNDGTSTAAPGPATPYPLPITVSGLTGTARLKGIRLNGYTHTFPGDNDMVIVGPGGQAFAFNSDNGGGGDIAAINITFDDDSTVVPSTTQLVSGTFRVTNVGTGDIFPTPGPTTYQNPPSAGTATLAATYGTTGSAHNGTWNVYMTDDASVDTGTISGGVTLIFEQTLPFTCTSPCAATGSPRSDFDGDGKSDVSVFRPSAGDWFLKQSTAGFSAVHWGASGDVIVPGDYNGDGKHDMGVHRSSAVEGAPDFYVMNNSTFTISGVAWGTTGDIACNEDYNGNGKTDFCIYRPSTNDFFVLTDSGATQHYRFGTAGDKPVMGDFDGDGKADFAVFRPSNNTWYYARSIDNSVVSTQWGTAGDILVPADYDGDAKDDIAVFRPSNGFWYILKSSGGQTFIPFGTNGDVPVPGDYDGDGKYDQAVYRGGSWFMNNSTSGYTTDNFGLPTDIPTERRYLPQ